MVDSLVIVGCGGAGVKFLSHIRKFTNHRCIGINDASGEIRVDREKIRIVESVHGNMIFQIYPWIKEISAENIVVVGGLGGEIGTNVAKIIGEAHGKKSNIYGIFSEPFRSESSFRRERTKEAKKVIRERYRGVFYLPNDALVDYYPNLKMEESMMLHPVVMRHIIQDFERMILKNSMNISLKGEMGIGIGFGSGKERIRLAVEDALDSPWLMEGKKYAFITGNVDREDVEVVLRNYNFEFWEFYNTEEYGEEIKATIIGKNEKN